MDNNKKMSKKIGVLGGGAWGTALACVMADGDTKAVPSRPIDIWAHEAETITAINEAHENPIFLSGVKLPENIHATSNLADMAACDILLMVVPAQFARGVLAEMRPLWRSDMDLVLCAKGVEQKSLKFMSEMAHEELPQAHISVLSGPSFAADVARGLPTAVTLAADDPQRGESLVQALGSERLRLYRSDDVIGAEIGGAIKNVLAIACGIVSGRGLGESARAATTARGFAEMRRLGDALKAKPETLTGLSGLGDLILTCASTTSRNFSLGFAIGEGRPVAQVLAERSSVSEGAMSAIAVAALAEKHGLDMPICCAINDIVNHQGDVDAVIAALLARPQTVE